MRTLLLFFVVLLLNTVQSLNYSCMDVCMETCSQLGPACCVGQCQVDTPPPPPDEPLTETPTPYGFSSLVYLDDADLPGVCSTAKWLGRLDPTADCEASRDMLTDFSCAGPTNCGSEFDRNPSYFSSQFFCCSIVFDPTTGLPVKGRNGNNLVRIYNFHATGHFPVNATLPTFPFHLLGLKLGSPTNALLYKPNPAGLPLDLETLVIFSHNFDSSIETLLSGVNTLKNIYLSQNGFVSPVYSDPLQFPLLETVFLDEPLTGSFPGFPNSPLTVLGITNTFLDGPVPRLPSTLVITKITNNPYLTSFDKSVFTTSLEYLNLQGNAFNCPFPNSIGSSSKLTYLNMNRAPSVYGPIPTEISLLTLLVFVDLSHNALTGPIPDMSASTGLISFTTASNALSGVIGPMPTGIKFFDVSSNALTNFKGDISTWSSVILLNAHHNQILGSLPSNLLSNLAAIMELDLSYNKYIGDLPNMIPRTPGYLVLDFSYNEFTGTPVYYNASVRTSIAGNHLTIPNGVYLSTEQTIIIDRIQYWGLSTARLTYVDSVIYPPDLYLYPQDVDDCASGANICQPNAECTDGWHPRMSFTCTCLPGFSLLADGQCFDINECINGQWSSNPSNNTGSPCLSKSQCLNTEGTFDCCLPGFENLDPLSTTCVDINECVTGAWAKENSSNTGAPCTSQSNCANTIGGFECCLPGYENLDPIFGVCTDINECVNGDWTARCSSLSNCVNQIGGFSCCPAGYENLDPINGSCVDINECYTGDWSTLSSLNTGLPCQTKTQCLNKIGGFECCSAGFENLDISNTAQCTDVDECAIGLSNCWSEDACVNTVGSFTCCPDQQIQNNGSCAPCFGNFQTFVPKTRRNVFKALQAYASLFFYFDSCLGPCDNAQSVTTKSALSSSCQSQYPTQLTEFTTCRFACSYDFSANAETTLSILFQEFGRGDFLAKVIKTIFNVDITLVTSRLRANQYSIQLNSCANQTEITNLIQTLAADILPNSTGVQLSFVNNNGNCSVGVTASDPTDLIGLAIGLPIGLAVLFLLLVLLGIYIWSRHRGRTDWLNLPKSVTWSFKKHESSPSSWTFRGSSKSGYFFKEFDKDHQYLREVIQYLKFGDLPIQKVVAVYNKTLITNFIGSYKIMSQRLNEAPSIFNTKTWDESSDLRQFVHARYEDRVKQFGVSTSVPIIPTVHGTAGSVCEKIAETGFASLSRLDDGFYGKGIYFTTYADYASSYIARSNDPAFLISWVLPGNAYPVTEHPKKAGALVGEALKGGYNSHYVVPASDGIPVESTSVPEAEMFDEIVIPQENQILPAFIVFLERVSLRKLMKERAERRRMTTLVS